MNKHQFTLVQLRTILNLATQFNSEYQFIDYTLPGIFDTSNENDVAKMALYKLLFFRGANTALQQISEDIKHYNQHFDPAINSYAWARLCKDAMANGCLLNKPSKARGHFYDGLRAIFLELGPSATDNKVAKQCHQPMLTVLLQFLDDLRREGDIECADVIHDYLFLAHQTFIHQHPNRSSRLVAMLFCPPLLSALEFPMPLLKGLVNTPKDSYKFFSKIIENIFLMDPCAFKEPSIGAQSFSCVLPILELSHLTLAELEDISGSKQHLEQAKKQLSKKEWLLSVTSEITDDNLHEFIETNAYHSALTEILFNEDENTIEGFEQRREALSQQLINYLAINHLVILQMKKVRSPRSQIRVRPRQDAFLETWFKF